MATSLQYTLNVLIYEISVVSLFLLHLHPCKVMYINKGGEDKHVRLTLKGADGRGGTKRQRRGQYKEFLGY